MSFIPRGGQWCLVTLKDGALQQHLLGQGAYGPDQASLAAVYVAGGGPSAFSVSAPNGQDRPEELPPRLQLVDAEGHDLVVPVRRPGGGGAFEPVWFALSDLNLASVRPATRLEHLPPGRVVHTRWAESFHNEWLPAGEKVALPPELHAASGHSLRVSEILQALAVGRG